MCSAVGEFLIEAGRSQVLREYQIRLYLVYGKTNFMRNLILGNTFCWIVGIEPDEFENTLHPLHLSLYRVGI